MGNVIDVGLFMVDDAVIELGGKKIVTIELGLRSSQSPVCTHLGSCKHMLTE